MVQSKATKSSRGQNSSSSTRQKKIKDVREEIHYTSNRVDADTGLSRMPHEETPAGPLGENTCDMTFAVSSTVVSRHEAWDMEN